LAVRGRYLGSYKIPSKAPKVLSGIKGRIPPVREALYVPEAFTFIA